MIFSLSSKTLSLGAAVALSAASVVVAQPAEALNVTRSTDPVFTNPVGYTTQTFNFNNSPTGNFGPDATLSGTPAGLTVTNTSNPSGNGSGNLRIENGSLVGQGGGTNRQVTFGFGAPLAYFGIRVLDTNFAGTIEFLSAAGTVLTSKTFASISGTGNYFNFYAPQLGDRFTSARITAPTANFRLDDVAYRVPTPALLPGLVGMGVAALRKRNANEEQDA